MDKKLEYKITHCDFFVLRTPLLPIDFIAKNLIDEIPKLDSFKEALLISSPNFFRMSQENKNPAKKAKISSTLLKYSLRSAYRCTPNATFASISTGIIGKQSEMILSDADKIQKFSRLDSEFLFHKIKQTEKRFKDRLTYFTNNTLYRHTDQLRFYASEIRQHRRYYYLSQINHHPIIRQLLSFSINNGKCYQELFNFLASYDLAEQEINRLLEQLMEAQLLVSTTDPQLTSTQYLDHYQQLENQLQSESSEKIKSFQEKLAFADSQPCGKATPIYFSLYSSSTEQQTGSINSSIIQVDAFRPLISNVLAEGVTTDLYKAVRLLATVQKPETDPLKDFKREFADRYEANWVPLLEVLDPQTGIRYQDKTSDPILEQIALPLNNTSNSESQQREKITPDWQQFLLEKFSESLVNGKKPVKISHSQIESLSSGLASQHLSYPFFAMINLLSPTSSELIQGNYQILLKGAKGPSGVDYLTRFSHVNPFLEEQIKKLLTQTIHSDDCLQAEIIHSSQPRMGNIASHPPLLEYEIPILTRHGSEKAIALNDLMIGLSNGELRLYSKRLNKRIIPRLLHAHDFQRRQQLPVYTLLCLIHQQGIPEKISFDWGSLSTAPFLPRVEYEKVILSPARWFLTEQTLLPLKEVLEDETEFGFRFEAIRQQLDLPDWVCLVEEDTLLPIHLKDRRYLKIVQDTVKKAQALVLQEELFLESRWLCDQKGNAYTNELIIPFKTSPVSNKENEYPKEIQKAAWKSQKKLFALPIAKTNFSTGSEWASFKLYCSEISADALLINQILPLTEQLTEKKVVDKWFFIRYHDPYAHIRIRFHGQGDFYKEVISQLHFVLKKPLSNKLVSDLKMDMYRRESRRYGHQLMEATETLFWQDSVTTLGLLKRLQNPRDTAYRFWLGIKTIEQLLTDFGLSIPEKSSFVSQMAASYKEEFSVKKEGIESLAKIFRKYKPFRTELIPENDLGSELEELFKLIENKNKRISPQIESLRDCPYPTLFDRLNSYCHMSINRFFPFAQRQYELLFFDFLNQFYKRKASK